MDHGFHIGTISWHPFGFPTIFSVLLRALSFQGQLKEKAIKQKNTAVTRTFLVQRRGVRAVVGATSGSSFLCLLSRQAIDPFFATQPQTTPDLQSSVVHDIFHNIIDDRNSAWPQAPKPYRNYGSMAYIGY